MTLRRRLLWLFTPLLVLTLLIIYALSERILLSRFDRQDQEALLTEAQQLHLYLDGEIERHLSMLRSYAWWDTSYAFIRQPNPDFVQHNLQSDVLVNLAFDFMFYFDQQGKVAGELWTPPDLLEILSVGDERPRSQGSLRQAILLRSQRLGSLDHKGDPQHALAQLVVVQGIPTLLLSSPISNSQGHAKPLGVIVAGHILDSGRLEQLQERVQGTLRLLSPSNQGVDWHYLNDQQSESAGGAQISPRRLLDDKFQQIELMFRNALGEPELRLEITKPRLLYQEGRKAIRFFLVTALLVAFVATLLLYLGLEMWILRRVQRMHREVSAIGHDNLPSRLSDQGNDELSQLACELNRMLERLQQSEARDRAILDSISDGYFELSPQGRVVTANRALGQMLNYSNDELIGRSYQEVLGLEDVERARLFFLQAMQEGGSTIFAAPFKRRDGSTGYFETHFSLINNGQGQFAGYHGILRDISAQVAYQNQLIDMAYRDPLTGLGNRKAFAEQLKSTLEQAQRLRTPQALLYLDLDRFKEVNDRFGHDVGDTLLIAIAERLRGTLRHPDRIYRLGGDEFTVLLPEADGEAAQKLAERMLDALAQPYELNGTSIDFVTPSIGIALYPDHAQDPQSLIKAADNAMYQAKRQRNSAWLYGTSEHPSLDHSK